MLVVQQCGGFGDSQQVRPVITRPLPPPTCPTTTSRDLLAQLDCKNSLLSSDNGKTFLLRTGNCEHNKKTERDRPLLGTAGRWVREERDERYES